MTRYEDTHESTNLINNIYMNKNDQCLNNGVKSKEISVLACVWNKCFVIASWYVLS